MHKTVRDGPTKKTYEKGKNDSQDNKAPVPRVIVSDKCNAKEQEDDAVTCYAVRQKNSHNLHPSAVAMQRHTR